MVVVAGMWAPGAFEIVNFYIKALNNEDFCHVTSCTGNL